MAETIMDVVEALAEAAKAPDKPIYIDIKETPLSVDAASVLERLKGAHVADGYHRVYEWSDGQMNLADVLTDREIEIRGYHPTKDQPIQANGDSALNRDVLRRHVTSNPLHETVWIGERLG
ncbi:MAG TPA: hypothetical protein VGQ65_06835 [Thermoanaerobaculia bacterium]|jgi:hypothetical protein|nr:hypothetical protein [Thermoanaerobaculia bacterium]